MDAKRMYEFLRKMGTPQPRARNLSLNGSYETDKLREKKEAQS